MGLVEELFPSLCGIGLLVVGGGGGQKRHVPSAGAESLGKAPETSTSEAQRPQARAPCKKTYFYTVGLEIRAVAI